MVKKFRALLCSLPWQEYIRPSIQIGAIAAFSQKKGVEAIALHHHLTAALKFGPQDYRRFMNDDGEALAATILFPTEKERILSNLKKRLPDVSRCSTRFKKILRNIFMQTDWHNYRLIGFTIDGSQLFTSVLMAQWIKKSHPDCRIVLGGQCASGKLGKSILDVFPSIDWCIDGEGELPFKALAVALSSNRQDFEKDIPGLIYRSSDGILTNERLQLESLDDLPVPDYDDFFETLRKIGGSTLDVYVPVEGGRGCVHRCAFCSDRVHMTGFRVKSAKKIVDQIQYLSSRHDALQFVFTDLRTHTKNASQIFTLLAKSNRDYDIRYSLRAESKKSLFRSMKSAGANTVMIGIEALNTGTLKKMNKGTHFIQNIQAMKYCEELGIQNRYAMILKFPTETREDVEASIDNIDFIAHLRPPFISKFKLFEGADVERYPERFNIKTKRESPYLTRLLPRHLRNRLLFMDKGFTLNQKLPEYKTLTKKCKLWTDQYYKAQSANTKLLSYKDGGNFLLIEDLRDQREIITLEEKDRKLYLFCDSIKTWSEIRNRFPKWNKGNLKTRLDEFIDKKIMYREDDRYLSLSIRNGILVPRDSI